MSEQVINEVYIGLSVIAWRHCFRVQYVSLH